MENIIPRWEWRTFGESFGEADNHFAALEPAGTQESDEIYFLSPAGDQNVKVRDKLMDIKTLEHVNPDGLEQWKPVMKGTFPLPAAEVKKVFDGLGVAAPPLTRADYTLDQFIDELAKPAGRLSVVNVHKKRTRYKIDGCMSEMTEVVADGKKTRTVAIESEDPARRHRHRAQVWTRRLCQYQLPPRLEAARRDEGLRSSAMPRYAVIDVGTNSVKFNISERLEDGTWRTVVDRAEITRLGEGLEKTGEISSDAMERTVSAIAAMASEAKDKGVAAIAAVGTMGMRTARNSQQFIDAVEQRSGIRIEVIPGDEEGRLAYLAVKSGLGLTEGSLAIFDTGGGSTQFTFGRGAKVEERFSLNVGAVRFTEQYGLGGVVSPEQLRAALDAIAAALARIDNRPSPDALVGMGGAITNMAAVKHGLAKYDPDVIQGSVIERVEVERQIELYRSRSLEDRRKIVGLQPKRADVILAGACIVKTVMDKLRKDSLCVSDRGLRHGLLIDRFANQ